MLQVPISEKREQHSITIPSHLWQFAKQVGRGNASAGISYLIEQSYNQASRKESHDSSEMQRTTS